MAVTSDVSPIAGAGATKVAVGSVVPGGKVRVLIGMRLTNGKLDQAITGTVWLRRNGNDYPFLPGALIPAGSSIEGLASSKFVMIAGDQWFISSNVEGSFFMFPSYDEDAP